MVALADLTSPATYAIERAATALAESSEAASELHCLQRSGLRPLSDDEAALLYLVDNAPDPRKRFEPLIWRSRLAGTFVLGSDRAWLRQGAIDPYAAAFSMRPKEQRTKRAAVAFLEEVFAAWRQRFEAQAADARARGVEVTICSTGLRLRSI